MARHSIGMDLGLQCNRFIFSLLLLQFSHLAFEFSSYGFPPCGPLCSWPPFHYHPLSRGIILDVHRLSVVMKNLYGGGGGWHCTGYHYKARRPP